MGFVRVMVGFGESGAGGGTGVACGRRFVLPAFRRRANIAEMKPKVKAEGAKGETPPSALPFPDQSRETRNRRRSRRSATCGGILTSGNPRPQPHQGRD